MCVECLCVIGEGVYIVVQVECVFWFDVDVEVECVQCWQQVVVVFVEGGVVLFEDGQGFWFEVGQCGVLGDVGCVDVQVLCQFFQVRYGFWGGYQLVEMLVGYVEIFGEVVQYECIVVYLQYVLCVYVVGQVVVDFIDYQVIVVCFQCL